MSNGVPGAVPPPRPARPRSAVRRLLLVAGSTIMAFGVGEGSLQTIFRATHGHWLGSDSFKAPFVRPTADRRRYSLTPGYDDVSQGLSIDELGFRKGSSRPGSEQECIVCLGDSVPFGAGVRDGETYPAHLARLLEAREMHVLNGGVPSYNLRQSIDRFDIDVAPRFAHVRALTLQAANDVSLCSFYGDRWSPDRTWADLAFGIPEGARGLAITHYVGKLRGNLDASPSRTTGALDAMLAEVRSNVDAFLRRCEKANVFVVLLPFDPFYYHTKNCEKNPSLRNWSRFADYERWGEMIDRFDAELASIASCRSNAIFLDSRAIFDEQDRDAMFIDFVHHTSGGNEVMAKALVQALSARGVLR